MLIQIADVFTPEEAAEIRRRLDAAEWVDGKVTAGYQSAEVKRNRQLPEQHPLAQELGNLILQRLSANNLFMSAALPRKIFPPLFNRYEGGEAFGYHVDNAVRALSGGSERVRTDLSATLFFSEPDSYDGGELVIDDTYGEQRVKLAAGDMVVYPGTSVHRVEPVTRGHRVASFFWVESMVRSDEQRRLLHDMDRHLMHLRSTVGETDAGVVGLTGSYHNLLRLWADT